MLTEINGVQYHYQVQGGGEPLLLLHGFTGSCENWRPLIPQLAKQFQTITVDLPGHGKTASPIRKQRYSMGPVANDLVSLMQSLGHEQFHLLGYSMGGRTALFLTVHHPNHVKSLVLESASPGLETEAERKARRQFDNHLADRIENESIEQFVDFWESISLWESQGLLPESTKQALRAIRLANRPSGLANSLRGAGTGQQPSLWPALSNLDSPVLLISGELDIKFCKIAAEMATHFKKSFHQTVPQAGHTIHLEKPSVWLDAIQNFLS